MPATACLPDHPATGSCCHSAHSPARTADFRWNGCSTNNLPLGVLYFYSAGLTCLDVNASYTVLSGAEDGSVRLSNIETGKVLGQMAGAQGHGSLLTRKLSVAQLAQVQFATAALAAPTLVCLLQ